MSQDLLSSLSTIIHHGCSIHNDFIDIEVSAQQMYHAFIGGCLIAIATSLYYLYIGRIFGMSGILGSIITNVTCKVSITFSNQLSEQTPNFKWIIDEQPRRQTLGKGRLHHFLPLWSAINTNRRTDSSLSWNFSWSWHLLWFRLHQWTRSLWITSFVSPLLNCRFLLLINGNPHCKFQFSLIYPSYSFFSEARYPG